MRFYPDADANFYVDVSDGWNKHCRYSKDKTWHLPHWDRRKPEPSHMPYYRDYEGAKKAQITLQDLYFPKWNSRRIRTGACLPLLYAMGARYIKLEKAFPAEFKCSPLPVGLAELRAIKRKLRAQARALKKWKKMLKAEAKECKKRKNRRKPKCKKLARERERLRKEGKLKPNKSKTNKT